MATAERRSSGGADILAWVAALVVIVPYMYYFGLLGRMGEHWVPMGLIAMVGLMIVGQLGAGVGLPSLFRDDPDARPSFFSRSFLSGLGATLLVLVVWTVVYYSEFLDHDERILPFEAEYGARHQAGNYWPIFNADQGLVIGAWASVLGWFLAIAAPPILLLLGLCVAFPTPELAARRDRSDRPGSARLAEYRGYITGMIAAFLIVLGLVYVGSLITAQIDSDVTIAFIRQNQIWGFDLSRIGVRLEYLTSLLRVRGNILSAGPLMAESRQEAVYVTYSMSTFILIFFVTYSAILALVRISPGLGISMIFSQLALAYLMAMMLSPTYQFVVITVALVGIALLNSRAFKYRYPGLEPYYRRPRDLDVEDERVEAGEIPEGPGLLDDEAVRVAWARRLTKPGGSKPKLVLVATSGGAYRASFWTTVVLDDLGTSTDLPGFLHHIRLMTGASGGMVGAAYVAAMVRPPAVDEHEFQPLGATARLSDESGGDSLTAVVQRLIRRDLVLGLWPGSQPYDRGRALEDQWKTLGVNFAALRQGEAEGWRPSLVLSPMVVETGRRLLCSNLDLYGLTEAEARQREALSLEPDDQGPRPQEGGGRLYSRSAVEFFRAFPDAYGTAERPDQGFQVKTAVRMNASFPYISPAVTLPVVPGRRVVDAGYYDNYGVNLAASWAYQNREWIRENTSGLALIQIRAYATEVIRKRLWVGARDAPGGPAARFFRKLSTGIQALTTPPEAAFNALTWSMSYRNDEQIRVLDGEYNRGEFERRPGRLGWFENFVFENPVPFGMNWFVTNDEIRRMVACIGPQAPERSEDEAANRHNRRQKQLLIDWWHDRHACRPEAVGAVAEGVM